MLDYTKYTGELICLCGLPGSGKSTAADMLVSLFKDYEAMRFETDDYFYNSEGEYIFDPLKLKIHHEANQKRVRDKMSETVKINSVQPDYHGIIIVSNTFVQDWELKPYKDLADLFNFRFHSWIIENRHGGKSKHGVPLGKIELMRKNFEVQL